MKKWFRWLFKRDGLWDRSIEWKLYTFRGEVSWWNYVKPPR